jgi:hypothetical protein
MNFNSKAIVLAVNRKGRHEPQRILFGFEISAARKPWRLGILGLYPIVSTYEGE